MEFLLTLGTVFLIGISLVMILLILMQRSSANAGLGTSFGGGVAESAFGAETGNILTRGTIYTTIAFFVLSFSLYLGHMAWAHRQAVKKQGMTLPAVEQILPDEASVSDTSISDATTGDERLPTITLPSGQASPQISISPSINQTSGKQVVFQPAEIVIEGETDSTQAIDAVIKDATTVPVPSVEEAIEAPLAPVGAETTPAR